MNRTSIAAICCLAGGWMLLGGKLPEPAPTPATDVLSQCYEADRVTKVALIREMATKEFANSQSQADWWNKKIDVARQTDFQPFIDATAEAIMSGTLTELAESLELKQ